MVTLALSHKRPTRLPRFYYGAAYYPEHWDADTRDKDAEWMQKAYFNCVRMGEFAWDRFEPEEGVFDFSLFDETLARLHEHGISAIMCTPTATPPRWLTMAHPEVLRVDAAGVPMQHGSRQHACVTGPLYREASRKITQALAQHYADHPAVVGWQTDNELNCHFSECHCPSCQAGFRDFLRAKYQGDIDALNAAWGTAFWALTFHSFDEIETPRNGRPAFANPAQMLDYTRFISWSTARFQHEQVAILRQAQPSWFVMHNGFFRHIDYRGAFGEDLDFHGFDVYPFFDYDPEHRPYSQAFNLDHARAWGGNFMIPEQQSGPGGQAPYLHDTPEPGELRRMAYTSIARGADSLLYFRWRTARFGAEEYWRGIIDHDNVPGKRHDEVAQVGWELKKLGPEILGTTVRVDVGIAAADVDVYDAHEVMSFGLPSPRQVAEAIHTKLLRWGYSVGCVHPSDDLSDLKAYLIPHWALFKEEWVPNLQAFVERGGVLIIGARTATKDWNGNVISSTPPGVLSSLAGVRVKEYGKQNAPDKRPLAIKMGTESIPTENWHEQLEFLARTTGIARWNSRHLEGEPAITLKRVGQGYVIYVGTYLTPQILELLLPFMIQNGLTRLWPDAPEGVHVVLRESPGKRLWFFINTLDAVTKLGSIPKGELLVHNFPGGGYYLYLGRNEVAVIKETVEA